MISELTPDEFERLVKLHPYGAVIGARGYDWTHHGNRTPEEYPYSFSAHYLWRDFDKNDIPKGVSSEYSDRMRGWDNAAYERAREAVNFSEMTAQLDRASAKQFVEIYHGGACECVGYARDCNVSNGYPLGIFFIRSKSDNK